MLIGEHIQADAAQHPLIVELQQHRLRRDLATSHIDEDQPLLGTAEIVVGEVVLVVIRAPLDPGQIHGVDDHVAGLNGLILGDKFHVVTVSLGQLPGADVHSLYCQTVGTSQIKCALSNIAKTKYCHHPVGGQLHEGVSLVALKRSSVHCVLV